MPLYYMVSWILLLPIIDLAVAAPVLAQERLQAHINVGHMPKDAMTTLGKRGGELNMMFHDIFGDTEDHFVRPDSPEDFANQSESSATRPSSSLQPSRPPDGPMAVEKPLPHISKELSQVSSPDRRAPLGANDGMMKEWLNIILGYSESAKPEESATRLSSSSRPLGLADGSMAVKKPLTSISKESSQVPSSVRASLNTNSKLIKMWLDAIRHPRAKSAKLEESSATRPLSSSQPASGKRRRP